jgi:ABC-type transporter Mla maintaining outer membrane lipid asymmetry ATPase subunit MlaF
MQPAQSKIPVIEVRHLEIGYGSFILVRDVSFTVKAGEVMAIMGESGCGKSTLLKYPALLFFDEPSAGLDPINSRRLDDLILSIRDSLGTTALVVTHELFSIFTIADTSIFLDADAKRIIAYGNPHELLKDAKTDPKVRDFLTRGEVFKKKPPHRRVQPTEQRADAQKGLPS